MRKEKAEPTFLEAFKCWLKAQDLDDMQNQIFYALVGDLKAHLAEPVSRFNDAAFVKKALKNCREVEFVQNVVNASLAHVATKH